MPDMSVDKGNIANIAIRKVTVDQSKCVLAGTLLWCPKPILRMGIQGKDYFME